MRDYKTLVWRSVDDGKNPLHASDVTRVLLKNGGTARNVSTAFNWNMVQAYCPVGPTYAECEIGEIT